jgi:hypothetical protein
MSMMVANAIHGRWTPTTRRAHLLGRFRDKWQTFRNDAEARKKFTGEFPTTATLFQQLAKFEDGQRMYYFIDDTAMIKSILKCNSVYATGPRRFGKSISLSMLESLLDGHCPEKQENEIAIYNPFSVMSAIDNLKLDLHWCDLS